jgi:hypothetical protein
MRSVDLAVTVRRRRRTSRPVLDDQILSHQPRFLLRRPVAINHTGFGWSSTEMSLRFGLKDHWKCCGLDGGPSLPVVGIFRRSCM